MRVTREVQRELLESLSNLGYGQAETEEEALFPGRFFPVREHARAFEPEVALVVGERGTGKSALFHAVFGSSLMAALARQTGSLRLAKLAEETVEWVPAYPRRSESPDAAGLRTFFGGPSPGASRGEDLWRGYLFFALRDHLAGSREALSSLLSCATADPTGVHDALLALGSRPVAILDDLDRRLRDEGRFLFLGYDELDTLGGTDSAVMSRAIQGLIAFWASYARRWTRIRPKIFIRTDLFRRHAGLGGSDLAKLAANRAELTWSDRNLYAMLLKRIANTSERLREFATGGRVAFGEPDPDLGFVPDLKTAEDAKPFVERAVGEFMGAGSRKGQSFRWLLDHVRDGKDRASPRALVRLVEQAAMKERHKPRAEPPQLLHPTSLRIALEDVSSDQVRQAMNNEWPWLAGVHARLREQRVPRPRREIERLLSTGWEESWGGSLVSVRPPVEDARELVDYLVDLGVLRERPNDRVDAPDLFLFGLELRRKGGVKTS